jgi:hypothetical protein
MITTADYFDTECYGCEHHELHEPVRAGEPCYGYCAPCETTLREDAAEMSADWYLWRLSVIRGVNPALVCDVMTGRMSFDAANHAAIEHDRRHIDDDETDDL